MTLRRALLVSLLSLALALATVACGGGAAVEPAASTGVATPAAGPAAEPTASTGGLPLDALPLVEFVRADGSTIRLPVEVPPRSDYGIGLSGRYSLDERGMLFHYDQERAGRGFWMKNTHIDLSVAFLGAGLRVVEVREMRAESLEIHRPEAPYQYAVEAPSGWYSRNGIEAGDRARFLFEIPAD